jgi:ketosteroid isomerase-like protein
MCKILLFVIIAVPLFSCGLFKKKHDDSDNNDKRILMEADRAFSKLSEQKGMKNAFLEYIDANGVLLRPDHLPLLGADAIDYLIQQNDSAYMLKWEPKTAVVAASGDLGYTYGVYVLKPGSKDTLLYGTYISIWKKQSDGKWKFVLDAGNEGIGHVE